MSSMKTNFSSTLNRWLGKKSKDKSTPNGKLSKSSTNLTNLSVSSTDINETSQLEYNRITPLPAATSNAPFEQTFRITVLLPKDQLYVTRLGARVPLSKLLELVCDHKLLEAEKFEFRNPVDPSQVYNNELTIGAVGLSEIRLCHKTDSYDTFNTDEVIKMHRTSAIRDSLSSSEFSSRNSKHTTKTTSPYSSSNSLNSMDSTGMNYTRTPVSPPPPLPHTAPPKMVQAPPRKKRAAPRPPSQMAIPEKSPLMLRNESTAGAKSPETPPTRPTTLPVGKDYYVSTPNLCSPTTNGETRVNGNSSPIYDHGYSTIEEEHLYAQVEKKNARNLCGGSVQNLSSPGVEANQKCPEPSPRRRLLHFKKKSAPAPPQRGSSIYSEDSISLASSTGTPGTPLSSEPTPISNGVLPMRQNSASSSITSEATLADATEVTPPAPPQPVVREADTSNASPLQASTPVLQTTTPIPSVPKPVPRQTTTTLLNASNETVSPPTTPASPSTPQANVSKVLLNRTPTPEPRSLSAEPPLELESTHISHHQHQLSELTNGTEVSEDDDNHSKQADSGIGEPVPSPVPDSLPSEGSTHDGKSTFESSSDDDDMVKVYNFKLGKTLIKPVSEHSTLEDLPIMQTTTTTTTITKTTTITPATTDSEASTPALPTSPVEERTPLATESTSWNFTAVPISPPPNFADGGKTAYELPPSGASKAAVKAATASEPQPDTPITPKIKQRPVLNFMTFTPPEGPRNTPSPVPPVTPASPITEIIDELSAIINEKRMDTLIKKSDATESVQIEAAKPNTLTNFTITTITQQQQQQRDASTPTPTTEVKNAVQKFEDEETEQQINQSPTLIVQHERKIVGRADSFNCTTVTQLQATATMQYNGSSSDNATNDVDGGGLNTRSASYLSLTKIEANGTNLNRRRSSSELSIGESPSLQSLEIIKTILNSRKNSAASGSGSDPESKVIITEIKPETTEQTKPKKTETKTATTTQSQNATEEENQQQQEPEPQLRAAVTKKETPSSDDEPPPRIYRYTGPPSINFSTWSERPKVQVSIKNEGDYIFGGKNASAVSTASVELSSASRNARASVPVSPPTPTKPEATTLQRMGIPEQSSRISVPITVRPLKDVTVESVELRSNAAGTQVSASKRNTTTLTFSVNAATPTTTNNSINNSNNNSINNSNNNNKTQTNHITHTSTLPRAGNANNNRFSVPAPINSTIVRANSITQLDGQRAKTQEESTTTAAPFGQNTLRKTGLKEKILAQEQQQTNQQPTSNNNNNNAKSTVPTTTAMVNAKPTSITSSSSNTVTTTAPTINLKPVVHTKTLQSAKLELKLQKSTSVYVNQTSPTPPPPPPTAVKPQSKPRQQLSSTAVTPPPPPPAPTVVVKSSIKTTAKSPSSADPRDALLEAIRNFKRAELKRA